MRTCAIGFVTNFTDIALNFDPVKRTLGIDDQD